MSKFYAVVKGDEDGCILRPVTDVQGLLADPRGEMGITDWQDAAFLGANPDPNYWNEGTAVLLHCEAVIPEPAGAYVLPHGE